MLPEASCEAVEMGQLGQGCVKGIAGMRYEGEPMQHKQMTYKLWFLPLMHKIMFASFQVAEHVISSTSCVVDK